MKMRFIILSILLFLIPFGTKAVKLDISVFNSFSKTEVVFSSLSGKYKVVAGKNTVFELLKGNELRIVLENDSILRLYDGLKILGRFSEIQFTGSGFLTAFSLHLKGKPTKLRDFDDDLIISIQDRKMQLINRVDIEHYTAGVVQSEALGSSKDMQFFFVQAITCRTYALVNYLKHADEGFNLCDDVHCQYYTGRCRDADISRATARTSGDVIVDHDNRMISAAFHSNCGGQTINSEDVWSIPTSYLKSVSDTFCLGERNAVWRYAIYKDDWLQFLKEHYDYPVDNPRMRIKAYTFKQPERKIYFENNIPLKSIRRDLHLRSTFFSIESKKDSVILHGRGYGHGVGLCQLGAIHMADLGINYKEIIRFYYADTRVIHYSELRYDFMP